MGKTSIALSAFDALWLAGSSKFPVLVIAPFRVARKVWSDECAKWDQFSNFRVSTIVGTPDQRMKALHRDCEIYTVNFENVPWLIEMCEFHWPFASIICDESTRLKGFRLSHGAKRAAALAKAAKYTARWVNLTGTPVPNGLIDLWGQQWFIDAGHRLGSSFGKFKTRWFDEDRYAQTLEPKSFAQEQIIDLISDVTVNLNAADHLDIHKPVYVDIMVDLPRKARSIYDDMEKKMIATVDSGQVLEAKTAADVSIKCLQIASGLCYHPESTDWENIHDIKIEALKDLLEELAGAPLLVAYHFVPDCKKILEIIPGARMLKSIQDEDDWNDGKILVGVVHPASVGHGLSLQYGGHHIAFYGHWWNLEDYMQVIERIGPVRQLQAGFDRVVFIYHIISRNTMDESVMERRQGKKTVQEIIRNRVRRLKQIR